MKSIILGLSLMFLSTVAAASAPELSPAVQAGVTVSFGGARTAAPKAALQFATGYVLGSMQRRALDELRPEDRPPTRLAMVSLLDGRFSGDGRTDAIRLAGFTMTRPGQPGMTTYGAADGEPGRSSWWSRNWWWVTLAAVGAGTATAVAGGGGEVEINANNGNGPSGDDEPGNPNGGAPCSDEQVCVCVADQVCATDDPDLP